MSTIKAKIARHKPMPTLDAAHIKKFWRDVKKSDGCWEWIGFYRDQTQYGTFCVDKTMYTAHRVSYWIHNGADPGNNLVCHTCDNKKCVNPGHLYVGTHKDNARDAITRGLNPNIRKTHCKRGHEFTAENTMWDKKNKRTCRMCYSVLHDKASKKYYAKNRTEILARQKEARRKTAELKDDK